MNRRKQREYLLRKEHEEKEKTILHNKQALKKHIDENKNLPHKLKKDASSLLQDMLHDIEEESVKPFKPILTTSRSPSDKLKKFTKRLSHILSANNMPRGNLTKEDLSEYMAKSEYNLLIIVNENRGIPTSMAFLEYPYGPSFYFSLHNVKLADFDIKGKVHFMAEDLEKDEMLRIKDFMCRLFSGSGDKRVVLMARRESFVCFRHYFEDECEGFDMRLYEIVRGTLEGGEKEFVYKPFMNTTRKKE
ncbi:snoRNA-binding rRNA-processing protein imp4 [Conglomerata obtusa]